MNKALVFSIGNSTQFPVITYNGKKKFIYMFAVYLKHCKPTMYVLVAQLRPTRCNHMDCSPPGFSVYGILQARILEWVAMPSSRGSS